MKIAKWVVLGIVLAVLIFGAFQGYLLNRKISEQGEALMEIQQGQEKLTKEVGKLDTEFRNTIAVLEEFQQNQEKLTKEVGKLDTELQSTKQVLEELAGGILDADEKITTESPLSSINQPRSIRRIYKQDEWLLHASACRAVNGDILVFFSMGSNELSDDVRLYMIRSEDNSLSWTSPTQLSTEPSSGYSMCTVLDNGHIIVAYASAPWPYPEEKPFVNYVIHSDDNGNTWSQLWTSGEVDWIVSGVGDIVKQPDTETNLLLAAWEYTDGVVKALVLKSTDMGESWNVVKKFISPPDHIFTEPALGFSRDGGLVCVIRDDGHWYYWISESEDFGENWSAPRGYNALRGSQASLGTGPEGRIILLSRQIRTNIRGWQSSHIGVNFYSSPDGIIWQEHSYLFVWPEIFGWGKVNAGYGSLLQLNQNEWACFLPVTQDNYFIEDLAQREYVGLYLITLTPTDLAQGRWVPATILQESKLGAMETAVSKPIYLESNNVNLSLTTGCTYSSSAKKGVKISIFSSYDRINYDTEPLETRILAFEAGATKRETFQVDTGTVSFLRVIVENLDSEQAVSNVKIVATIAK